ncbi:MAG: HDOD domain-containing protein [Nitrospira sp.]|nr:HDOD domain-containing protein [Nitrospira sp.]MDH4304639.1 HDOD domain-containing protein [Nitrospira sp.]MDH5194066.1 HDOD domain-containing protein [Nitrospira sp.]
MPLASELVQACTTVPTLPEVYCCVRDVVDDPNATMGDQAKTLQLDPIITARVLRLANNAPYGPPRQVGTVTGAVQLLGKRVINEVVATTTVGQTFAGIPVHLMDLSKFWRKSVFCGLLAQNIAKSCRIAVHEQLYLAGLLRDIGHGVLYQTVPQRAQSALIEAGYLEASLAEVEQSNIGCDFAEVGAELIRSWGLPVQIEQAVRCQLSPKDAGEFIIEASIVHLAGCVADYEELDSSRRPVTVPFSSQAVAATGFVPTDLPTLLAQAKAQLQETLAMIQPYTMAA